MTLGAPNMHHLPSDHAARVTAAKRSLDGLSVGDAFGERFFVAPDQALHLIELRALPSPPWSFTDDTVMAMSIVDVLEEFGDVEQDVLAGLFAGRYRLDPARGYGGGAHEILGRLAVGEPWTDVSPEAFNGTGSMGNGGAMRAAPIGAYFAGDFAKAARAAARSAEVTHAHAEGQAGAVAVAVAAAWMCAGGTHSQEMYEAVLDATPEGETRRGVSVAMSLPESTDTAAAVQTLGNGSRVLAQDTVPFALWCAARHLGDFEGAMWRTVSGLGDRDTTCAIVGGIICAAPNVGIPEEWLEAREDLDRMSRSLVRTGTHGTRGA
jgi:ADP-ribosylglycohydrolase